MTALLLAATPEGYGVGIEWMPIASIVTPFVLLIAIWYFGSRNAV